MELLVLILVNIVTAVVMYVVFSIRFTKAVEEARANPIIRELKDNIQITIEFINTSLDLMDEKTKTFYQLVRRSEEIAKQLEESPKPARRSTAKSSSKSAGKTTKKASSKTTRKKNTSRKASEPMAAAIENPPTSENEPAPPLQALGGPGIDQDHSPGSDPMERALSGLGDDRLDLTPPADDSTAAYRAGELSAGLAQAFGGVQPAQPGPVGRFLSGMGSRMRSLFGGGTASAGTSDSAGAADSTGAPLQQGAPTSSGEQADFAGVLSRTGDRLVAKAEREAAARNRQPRSMNPRDILELSSESAEQIIAQSLGTEASPASAPELPGLEGDTESAVAGRERMEPRQPASSPEAEKLNIDAVLARSGLDLRDRSPAGRADRIKELLRHGFDPRAISAGTGIALPEVELIASLPEGAMRPRRRRRTED